MTYFTAVLYVLRFSASMSAVALAFHLFGDERGLLFACTLFALMPDPFLPFKSKPVDKR